MCLLQLNLFCWDLFRIRLFAEIIQSHVFLQVSLEGVFYTYKMFAE